MECGYVNESTTITHPAEPPVYPEISILIVAHERREYLRRAVDSARNQLDPGVSFEVVVVTDFDEPWFESLPGPPKIRFIRIGTGRVGELLAEGIANCLGRLIFFLDDDDSFLPGKLRYTYRLFREHPNLVYAHNRYRARTDGGSPVHSPFRRGYRRNLELPGAGQLERSMRAVAANSMVTNLSCVTVTTSLVKDRLEAIRRIDGSTDYLFFYLAIASRGQVRFDSTPLTNYYIHPSAMRPQLGGFGHDTRLYLLTSAQITVHEFGASLPPDLGVRPLCESLLTEWRFLRAVSAGANRGEITKKFAEFLASSLRTRWRFVVMCLPVFLGSLIRPSLGYTLVATGRGLVTN